MHYELELRWLEGLSLFHSLYCMNKLTPRIRVVLQKRHSESHNPIFISHFSYLEAQLFPVEVFTMKLKAYIKYSVSLFLPLIC